MGRRNTTPARSWAFTTHNPGPGDRKRLERLARKCKYLVYGEETTSTGTPHLQGTVVFHRRRDAKRVRLLLGGKTHVEKTRHNLASFRYCKKGGRFTEYRTRRDKANTDPPVRAPVQQN